MVLLSVCIITDHLASRTWKAFRTWVKAARVMTLTELDNMVSIDKHKVYSWLKSCEIYNMLFFLILLTPTLSIATMYLEF